MKKEKIIIKNTQIEINPDGTKVVRVTLAKGDTEYIKGIRYTDLGDPQTKQSVFRGWTRDIEKIEAEKAIKEDEVKSTIAALVGEEIFDE